MVIEQLQEFPKVTVKFMQLRTLALKNAFLRMKILKKQCLKLLKRKTIITKC